MPGTPTQSDLHVDARLTDFAVAHSQDPAGFIARRVFRPLGVARRSNKYTIFTKSETRRSDARNRAPGTESAIRTVTVSTDQYYCDRVSIGMDITEEDMANADDIFDLESDYTRQTVDDIRIKEEVDWAAAAFTTGVWDTDKTGTTDFTKWSDPTSTPIEDGAEAHRTLLLNTGRKANTVVLGINVWLGTALGTPGLIGHPDIISRLPDNAPRLVQASFLAQMWDVDNVFFASGAYNTAQEGLAESSSFIAGNHALFCYVDPNPGRRSQTCGRTFVWSGLVGAVDGYRTKNYPIEEKSILARIETDTAYDHKVVDTASGYLFASAV